MNRREFFELSVALGATLAWARGDARRIEARVVGTARAVSAGRRVRRSASGQRAAVDAASAGEPARRPSSSPSKSRAIQHSSTSSPPRARRCPRRATGRAACSPPASQPATRVLVSLHRRQRSRQPHRPHARRRRARTTRGRVRFAFVSCQNVNQGAQNAYRRMIFEDERAAAERQLDFVLHLGDFIYEIVWYPGGSAAGHVRPQAPRRRAAIKTGEKIRDFHVPATLDDYRAVYRGYLQDPDLQDARARWPFVCVWDNHEFSWRGWQGFVKTRRQPVGPRRRAKSRPTRRGSSSSRRACRKPGGGELERFDAPAVVDAPVERFDEHGLGQEPNNLAAIDSLHIYRALRFGRQRRPDRSPTSTAIVPTECATDAPAGRRHSTATTFPDLVPEEVNEILDAGRDVRGRPAAGDDPLRRQGRSRTCARTRRRTRCWARRRRPGSSSTLKALDRDLEDLGQLARHARLARRSAEPAAGVDASPGPAPATRAFGGGDWTRLRTERAEIYDFVRDADASPASRPSPAIATASGRACAAKALPPARVRAGRRRVHHRLDLRAGPGRRPASTTCRRTIRCARCSCTRPRRTHRTSEGEHAAAPRRALVPRVSRDAATSSRRSGSPTARLSPHLSFVDMGGHGYAAVRAGAEAIEPGVRVHPAARRAQHDAGRRPARLPRRAPREAVARRRDAPARTHAARRQDAAVYLRFEKFLPRRQGEVRILEFESH